MSVDDLAGTPYQAWDLEAELPDRRAHSIHCGVVFAGITGILYKAINRPQFDALSRGFRAHTYPSKSDLWDPSEAAPWAPG